MCVSPAPLTPPPPLPLYIPTPTHTPTHPPTHLFPHPPTHPHTHTPHKVDVSRGTFSATFYAHFTTERGAPPYPENIDIRTDNKLAERILQNAASFPTSSQVRKMERSNTTQQVRMKAKFYFSSQNHKFPFETQSLVIAIEDPKQVRRRGQWGGSRAPAAAAAPVAPAAAVVAAAAAHFRVRVNRLLDVEVDAYTHYHALPCNTYMSLY